MFAEFHESWQVIVWDGLRELSDSQSALHRDTRKWIGALCGCDSDVFVTVHPGAGAFCAAFSFVHRGAHAVLAMYAAARYAPFVFAAELLRPLRRELAAGKRRVVLVCRDVGARAALMGLFGVKIAAPVYLFESRQQWANTVDATGIREELRESRFSCALFADGENGNETLYRDVRSAEFALDGEGPMERRERERLVAFLFHTHRIMRRVVEGSRAG